MDLAEALLARYPDVPPRSGLYESLSHGWVSAGGAVGAVELDSLEAAWDLRFVGPEPPFPHLPKPWMYTAPLPRTKSISAAPALALAGSLMVDGRPVDVDGWPCSIGHNWGAEHAERWGVAARRAFDVPLQPFPD